MENHLKRIDRKLVYKGAIIDMYEDTILFEDGHTASWDFIAHRLGAAAVVPVTKEGKIVMVSQYRSALDRMTLEIPAGSRDHVDEDTMICAKRELEEETGYVCEKIEKLLALKTTVAFCNEFIDVYLATGLTKKEQHLDEDEYIEILEYDLEDLLTMIYEGKIQDAKTVSGILAYANKKKNDL